MFDNKDNLDPARGSDRAGVVIIDPEKKPTRQCSNCQAMYVVEEPRCPVCYIINQPIVPFYAK